MSSIDSEINALKQKIADLEKKRDANENAMKHFAMAKKDHNKMEYYLPDDHDYQRMQDSGDHYREMSYEEFISWNLECIECETLNNDSWMEEFCRRIYSRGIKLVDMESCAEMTAQGIYFDRNGNLCITCPR